MNESSDKTRQLPQNLPEDGGGQAEAPGPIPFEPPVPEISDHELVRQIGRGSYGVVWLCRNVMGTYRGVKVVYRQSFEENRPFEREFGGIQSFEPVSRTHPGLVAVLQIGIRPEAGYFYYVMEVADDTESGQSIDPGSYEPRNLRNEMTRRRRLPVEDAAQVGVSLCAALGHLHRHRLLHRDVKSSNVIFVNDVPKLADIGLVTKMDEARTLLGTPPYMAPEGPMAATADLYSLGIVLYEISTGKNPRQFPELPADLVEAADASGFLRLNRIILKACAHDPRARYQRAEEMREALAALAGPSTALAQGATGTARTAVKPVQARSGTPRLVLLYKSGLQPDARLVDLLQHELGRRGYQVVVDKQLSVGVAWVREIERELRGAEGVVLLLSAGSAESEMLAYDIEVAHDASRRQQGRPRLLPVRVRWSAPWPGALAGMLARLPAFAWDKPEDNPRLVEELVGALRAAPRGLPLVHPPALESPGGAVPLESRYYIVRPTDEAFQQAIERKDSIVLVKGARQMGKTSLLARGLQHAREAGSKVVLADFQKLDATHLASSEALFRKLGDFLADQLDLEVLLDDAWDERRSANTNFERYLRREVLAKVPGHLVWGMDEVDRLFACSFASEVFGLLRSWHNERALDPSGPWSRLTLAIAYATEAHLFITDVNQSPFNVGTRLTLEDFDPAQVSDLNRRYGGPLTTEEELRAFFQLLGGQPYLVRYALNELASGRVSFAEFVGQAHRDEGIFGDHLRRILVLLAKNPELCEIVRGVLAGQPCRDAASFYRLRSAGVMKGDAPEQAQPRCEIYARYLERHFAG